jgi:hypothetical protein
MAPAALQNGRARVTGTADAPQCAAQIGFLGFERHQFLLAQRERAAECLQTFFELFPHDAFCTLAHSFREYLWAS